MKVIRTYTRGKDVSYQFPSTNKRWTVQFANNIRSISLVGQNNSDSTADQIQEIQALGTNLTCLNDYCFNNAVGLNDVYLSPQIKSINERCFKGCTGIRTVSYDIYETCTANMTEKIPSLDHIGNYAFAQCTGMRSMTLPESINNVSQIDSLAFAGSNLTSVTFLGITSSQLLGG